MEHTNFSPLESPCIVCGTFGHVVAIDNDMGGKLCADCFPHVVKANELLQNDMREAGLEISNKPIIKRKKAYGV